MGNGLPLAGVVARGDLVDAFRKRSGYFNTFAASPLQAAVGSAVLDVIETEKLQQRVAEVGSYLRRWPRQDRVRSDGRCPREWPLHRARLGE